MKEETQHHHTSSTLGFYLTHKTIPNHNTLTSMHTSMLHSTICPPNCHPPMPTPTLYPSNYLRYTPSRSLQYGPSCYHQWPPPQNSYAPYATMSPPPHTPHKTTHNEVSKSTCHYHPTILHTKKQQKLKDILSIGLPPTMDGHRSPPPHTATNYLHQCQDPLRTPKPTEPGMRTRRWTHSKITMYIVANNSTADSRAMQTCRENKQNQVETKGANYQP